MTKEQADKLSVGRVDLLTDDDALLADDLKPNSSECGVVIGKENGIKAESPTPVSKLFRLTLRVKRR